MPGLSPLSLEGLRAALSPEYAGMEAADLERLVENAVSGLPEDSAENVMSALSSIGKAVAPTLQRAAPAMAQGAASGATIGGPWGALIGAGAGLASTAMSGKAGSARKAAPAAPPSAAGPTAAPSAPEVPALPSGQGAAATLLGLMQNPMVQRAILSQVLGAAGSQEIPTPTGEQIPRGAINNLLMQLLASASEALTESESVSDESYLRDQDGEYLVDPGSPEQQAAMVLAHLSRAAPRLEFAAESSEWIGDDALVITEDVEFADGALESVEFY